MKTLTMQPFYDLSVKGLNNPDGFKVQVDQAVREMVERIGRDIDIRINVEPGVKSKGIFWLSLSVNFFGQTVVVRKKGRSVYSLLKKAKKSMIKIFRRSRMKRLKNQRQPIFVANNFNWREAS